MRVQLSAEIGHQGRGGVIGLMRNLERRRQNARASGRDLLVPMAQQQRSIVSSAQA